MAGVIAKPSLSYKNHSKDMWVRFAPNTAHICPLQFIAAKIIISCLKSADAKMLQIIPEAMDVQRITLF